MAEDSEKSREPNLELPSLPGFRRRKKGPTADPADERSAPEVEPSVEPSGEEDKSPLVADPVEPPRSGLAPAADAPKRMPPVPPPSAPAEPTPAEPEAEPEPEAAPEPLQQVEPLGLPEQEPAQEAGVRRAPREPVSLPVIPPPVAAVVTGAVVGLVGVVLADLSSRGCEAVRGVGSCGGVGLFALLAILAIEVVLGAALLKAWRLSDPTSTSFLGVGLAAMLVLLFLLGSLESVWMLLVLPVLTAVTFLVSWWVTVSFVESSNETLLR